MADQFVAEIRIFGFNFPPTGWAYCDGQLLPIAQNTALFSLLGTTYGGNGQTNFALPNLQDQVPRGVGQGQGLSNVDLGEAAGAHTVTLLESEIPAHTHAPAATSAAATEHDPSNGLLARPTGNLGVYGTGSLNLTMQPVTPTGGGLPHNNVQPSLTLNFCIAMQGIFPPR